MRHTWLGLFSAALVGLIFSIAHAADAGTSGNDFVGTVAVAGKFEIESGKLALQRSKNQAVRSFAQRMIADHTETATKMKAVITELGMAQPADTLDQAHQTLVDGLQTVDAASFDRAYIDEQRKAHEEAVDLFQRFSQNGDSPRLKQFAVDTLPTLRTHLEIVKALH